MRRYTVVLVDAILIGLAWCVLLPGGEIPSTPSTGPVTLRLVHPDRQLAEILGLFEGSPYPHPAAALAAWKRSSREPERLGKRAEAVIAFFNPDMVGEWRSLHEARLDVGTDPGLHWSLTVPHDDGTLAALVTALRLSGGSLEEAPRDGRPALERLGGASAFAARSGSGVILAGSREALEQSFRNAETVEREPRPASSTGSGLSFRIEPQRALTPPTASLALRRLLEGARALGCVRIDGRLAVEGGRLGLEAASELDHAAAVAPGDARATVVDPEWLGWIPAREVAAVFSMSVDGSPRAWDRLFALADRVDRADPKRADLAPLRVRLNLLAAAAGARLEALLWPHLRGLTVGLLSGELGRRDIGPVVLCLHLDGDDSARRILAEVLPRLGGRRSAAPSTDATAEGRPGAIPRVVLGRLSGRPVEAMRSGSTVVVGWGEGVLDLASQAAERPSESVRPLLLGGPADAPSPSARPDRVGLLWPGRLPIGLPGLDEASPLATSLAEGAPLVWSGWTTGKEARDLIRWPALREWIARFLASIPPKSLERG